MRGFLISLALTMMIATAAHAEFPDDVQQFKAWPNDQKLAYVAGAMDTAIELGFFTCEGVSYGVAYTNVLSAIEKFPDKQVGYSIGFGMVASGCQPKAATTAPSTKRPIPAECWDYRKGS
jgi:hypothetical protein